MKGIKTILGASLALTVIACGEKAPETEFPPRPVRAMEVGDPESSVSQNYPGLAQPTQEVDLSFRIAGTLEKIPVQVGDWVKQGEIVASLDPRDYENAVKDAHSQLQKAKASLRRTEADFQRVVAIQEQDPGAMPARNVEEAQQLRDADLATVRSLGVALMDAQNKLKDTYLRAPFEGQVVAVYPQSYQEINKAEPVVRILDTMRIEMTIQLPESGIWQIGQIESCTAYFDAYPGTNLPAEIKEVGYEASSTTRTYPITLIMDQPESMNILPGMAGRAEILFQVPHSENIPGIPIPPVAIVGAEDGRSYVWVIGPNDTVHRRLVTVGNLADDAIYVTQGVEPGDWVVTAGASFIEEGQKVRVMQ